MFLFASLSGYLLLWPFVRHTFGEGAPVDLRTYARNRAVRILSLYYFAVILLLIVQESGGPSSSGGASCSC